MDMETKVRPRFPLGHIAATPGAMNALQGSAKLTALLLARHVSGDCGDMCAEDKAINGDAIRHGARIMSSYDLIDGEKLWIITEADRSSTTLLLPSEY